MTEPSTTLEEALAKRVRENFRDGASRVARIALDALAEYIRRVEADDPARAHARMLAFADTLAEARPEMHAVAALVTRWRRSMAAVPAAGVAALRRRAADEVEAVRAWAEDASERAIAAARARIGRGACVLTHSASSTVTRALLARQPAGVRVIVTESRPGNEGHALAATLARAGLPVTYITDAQAGVFVGEADLVLVGADALLADGAVVNKVGTRLIALAAREAGTPFFACAEGYKRRPETADTLAPAEEPAFETLDAPQLPGVRARNVYFEVTPAHLITDWLSEGAPATPSDP